MVEYSKYKQTADQIVISAIKAMTKKAKEYSCSERKWTRGYYAPWLAPEYIYTVAVAQAANPVKRGVYLEYNIKSAVEDGVIKRPRGRPEKIPEKSRCDILIADGKIKNVIPRFCIEIKTGFGVGAQKDLKKCRRSISGKGESMLRDAAVIFISAAAKKNTLKESFEQWRCERVKKEKGERIFSLNASNKVARSFRNIKLHEYTYEKQHWFWYVGAVQMSLTEHQ